MTTDTSEIDTTLQDNHFLRTGFYASLFVQDLNVFGAYLHGSDSVEPVRRGGGGAVEARSRDSDYHAAFMQADYMMLHPWLQAGGPMHET